MINRNATVAFVGELNHVVRDGKIVTVRGDGSRELLARRVVISNPLERLIAAPGRRNDVVATIAETMWVLSGRDDVAFFSDTSSERPVFR